MFSFLLLTAGASILEVGAGKSFGKIKDAIDAAREAGVDVPNKLSVTGFDDLENNVPDALLTSVYFDRQLMGKMAVRRIYDAAPQEKLVQELLPVHVALRSSTHSYGSGTVAHIK